MEKTWQMLRSIESNKTERDLLAWFVDDDAGYKRETKRNANKIGSKDGLDV